MLYYIVLVYYIHRLIHLFMHASSISASAFARLERPSRPSGGVRGRSRATPGSRALKRPFEGPREALVAPHMTMNHPSAEHLPSSLAEALGASNSFTRHRRVGQQKPVGGTVIYQMVYIVYTIRYTVWHICNVYTTWTIWYI